LGTVLMKLLGGSRFTRYDQRHLAALNLFLDELEPKLSEFLQRLIQVSSPDLHYSDGVKSIPRSVSSTSGLTSPKHSAVAGVASPKAVVKKASKSSINILPVALVCNDLFALHHILRGSILSTQAATVTPATAAPGTAAPVSPALSSTSHHLHATSCGDSAPGTGARTRRKLADVLAKLGTVPRMLPDGRNDYVIVDLGTRSLLAGVFDVRSDIL